jgi:hypothetical protein
VANNSGLDVAICLGFFAIEGPIKSPKWANTWGTGDLIGSIRRNVLVGWDLTRSQRRE